ncbi:hypothetical protein HDV02_004019 [Globomyces sp. JEL0801]|nr:hypothetical protein HDV02_004019 [Globomyces sp. JEL0801]
MVRKPKPQRYDYYVAAVLDDLDDYEICYSVLSSQELPRKSGRPPTWRLIVRKVDLDCSYKKERILVKEKDFDELINFMPIFYKKGKNEWPKNCVTKKNKKFVSIRWLEKNAAGHVEWCKEVSKKYFQHPWAYGKSNKKDANYFNVFNCNKTEIKVFAMSAEKKNKRTKIEKEHGSAIEYQIGAIGKSIIKRPKSQHVKVVSYQSIEQIQRNVKIFGSIQLDQVDNVVDFDAIDSPILNEPPPPPITNTTKLTKVWNEFTTKYSKLFSEPTTLPPDWPETHKMKLCPDSTHGDRLAN